MVLCKDEVFPIILLYRSNVKKLSQDWQIRPKKQFAKILLTIVFVNRPQLSFKQDKNDVAENIIEKDANSDTIWTRLYRKPFIAQLCIIKQTPNPIENSKSGFCSSLNSSRGLRIAQESWSDVIFIYVSITIYKYFLCIYCCAWCNVIQNMR